LFTKSRLANGYVAGLRIDITSLKAAETALRDSERRFQDIAEVSGDWMWETTASIGSSSSSVIEPKRHRLTAPA